MKKKEYRFEERKRIYLKYSVFKDLTVLSRNNYITEYFYNWKGSFSQ